MKAVRDSEGNSLHQSHIVGFFRRICKLLYFGILPVFVFDGGAPALKRETIKKRRERREGKRESATETAQRLLAIHVQRQTKPQKTTYLQDLPMQHPQQGLGVAKRFVPADEYHLPELKKIRISDSDARLMPEDEFNEITGESFDIVDGVDINHVDPKSSEFANLPMATQYMILSHLRLKSRLRMGYTKDQLQEIFNSSMDFSKFQIQQVQRRNFYTQKLMDISGMGDEGNATRRIAGERDRKYALVRSGDGWSISLGENKEEEVKDLYENVDLKFNPEESGTKREFEKAIEEAEDIEEIEEVGEDEEDSDDFEDIPIKEETEEEKEYQQALVASIYENYKNEEDGDERVFDLDLEKAIEESKRDFFELKEREERLEERKFNLQSEEFNLDDSLLFSSNKEVTGLFGKEKREDLGVVDIESESENESKGESELETERKVQNEIPSWFQNEVDERSFNYEMKDKDVKEKETDEEVGLIAWNEAKLLLDGQAPEESEPEEEKEEPEEGKKEQEKKEEEMKKQENGEKEEKEPFLDYEFVPEEDDKITKQLENEYVDHENFKSQIKLSDPLNFVNTSITEEHLLQEKLQKQKRDAEEVTVTMINDVKELLRRFGIPFVTAPMEAEAQCAELFKLGLVDGIITDDSDCFLFGGDRIYKNMFNQKQYVECYIQDELYNKLGLDQEKLIELGLVLGSDYTEGIKGIGPVLAMELLAEFGSLRRFKQWFDDCSVGKTDTSSMLKKTLLKRIKNNKLYLPSQFPDKVVYEAYMTPEVDSSNEEIKWGIPDLDQIRSFLMYNVGWSQAKVDEVMVPLVRDMNRKLREGTQSTIGEFFPVSHGVSRREAKVPKRIKVAASKLSRNSRN